MKKAAIIIPIYKEQLSESEVKSLLQCIKVLNKYPIIFVCSKSLNVHNYEHLCQQNNTEVFFERFEDKYFSGLLEYSQLLLNIDFYKRFKEYTYILIYQLDAWVFEDKLQYWCEQGYDYIGAPWFEGFDTADMYSKILPLAGNGGFSLRNVDSIIKILKKANSFKAKLYSIYSFQQIFKMYKKRHLISNLINLPKFLIYKFKPDNLVYYKFKKADLYEDIMFVEVLSKLDKNFKLAQSNIAMHFSFETLPERLYKMTNNKLPFGCHAYEKYNFDFWKPYIET